VMVVTVEQAFPHCPKALVRSDLWKAASSGRPRGVPTLGDFVAAREPGTDSAAFDAAYSALRDYVAAGGLMSYVKSASIPVQSSKAPSPPSP